MKKLLVICLLLWFLILPVAATEGLAEEQAEQFGAEQLEEGLNPDTRRLLSDFSATDSTDFAQGVSRIIQDGAAQAGSTIRQSLALSAMILGITLLCGVVSSVQDQRSGLQPVSLIGAVGITAACTVQFHAMIQLGAETIQTISDYATLLLPAIASATVASGAVGTASAIYTGTVLFTELLTVLIAKVLVPMVYLYIAVATVNAAMDHDMLMSIRDFIAWLITGSMKTVLYVFTTYITLSGVISGASDALSVKATKLALGGMVPVVGGILSDASETVVISASMLKNSMGIFGMLAILGFCTAPFFKIAVQYLLLKVTKAVCGTIGRRNHVELVGCLGRAMGFLLAMTGTCCLMLLLSIVCSLRVVNG